DGDIDAIDDLFSRVQSKASPELQQAFAEVRRDLRDAQVQAEFGVEVVSGRGRVAAFDSVREIKETFALSTTLAHFAIFAYRLARRKKRARCGKKSVRWRLMVILTACTALAGFPSDNGQSIANGKLMRATAPQLRVARSGSGLTAPDPLAQAQAKQAFS